MSQPLAYLNGRLMPAGDVAVAVWDAGFVQGTTVAEQLRTFGGRLFRLEAHVERLFHSLAIVGVEPGLTARELCAAAGELAIANHALLQQGDDLGLSMFVTPGPYAAMAPDAPPRPTLCMHTFPLAFGTWAHKFDAGESLATTDVVQVSPRSWPPELKCRSRMHYFLADRQARFRHPLSRALMLDEEGFVVETTTANVVLFRRDEGLITPPAHKILPGISLAVLAELAAKLGLGWSERDLVPADVAAADEVMLTSTSVCALAVVQFNGQPIAGGRPGATYRRLMAEWNQLVGLDVAEQARRFAGRGAG